MYGYNNKCNYLKYSKIIKNITLHLKFINHNHLFN